LDHAVVVWSSGGIVAGGVVEGVGGLGAAVGVTVGEDNALRGCTFGKGGIGRGGRGSIIKNDDIGGATYFSWGLDGGGGSRERGERAERAKKVVNCMMDCRSEVRVWMSMFVAPKCLR
jgi:hypothetical protein